MICRSPKQMVSAAFSLAFLVISLASVSVAAPIPSVVVQAPMVEGIRSPIRAAADSLGNVYVTDALAIGINKYDVYGHLAQFIKTSRPPHGIAVALDGALLVGMDTYVSMFDATGKEIGMLGAGAGQFQMAGGITVADDGTIYVVDSLANCVQVFNAAGGYVKRFGSFGTAAGAFSTPTGIAFEKVSKQVAVADTRNGRVQFFDKNGTYVRTIGAFGSNPLKFTAPQGVAFEYTGGSTPALSRMYVVDTFQSQVQAIDPAATPVFLSYIGNYGGGNGSLMVPSDVAFDQANGRLFVVNGFGNLTVYGIDGGAAPADAIPPALTIDPLAPLFYSANLDVSGTMEAGATVTVTAGGVVTVGAVTYPTSSTWRTTLSGFAPGAITLTATARDAARNATTQTATSTYLLPAPLLTLDTVPSFTADASQLLSGTVEPGSAVTVTNNTTGTSSTAMVFGDTWSHRVSLAAGLNGITITAKRTSTATATVTTATVLDDTPPVLTVSALPNGSYTSEQVQNIQVLVSDANPGTVILNGEPVTVENGTFSSAVTLNAGPNVITVTAADLLGNVATDTRTIFFDATRPVVTFTAPAEGAHVAANRVTVSGGLDQAATVTVAGQPATMAGTDWSATVVLEPGLNTLEVTAVDKAGNVTTVKRTVVFDADAPTLVITTPAQDMAVNTKNIALTGLVSDATAVTFTASVNGVPVQVDQAGGSFALGVLFADEGTYAVTITATDAAGNQGTVTRTLIFDTIPPALTVAAANTAFPSELTGTVEAGATVTVEDKNGLVSTVATAGDTWRAPLSLDSYDSATLAVRATDAAGNSTVKSLVVQAPDGDISGDAKVNIQDALLALRIYMGTMKPTARHLANGDIGPLVKGKAHPNGTIDMVDAILILRRALGMPSW